MQVKWTRTALTHVAEIHDYIAKENPAAARRVVDRIKQETSVLSHQPGIGRLGRVEKTRELVITRFPYIVVYRSDASEVTILAVIHTSRAWPERI